MGVTATSPSLTARVSRRDLAHNRYTWFATSGVGIVIAAFTVGVGLLEDVRDPIRLFIYAAVYGGFALALLRRAPPSIDEPFNHVVLAYAYSATILGFWVFQPGGGIAIGTGMFIGPLIAVRLIDRRLILFHLLAASSGLIAIAIGAGVAGEVDTTTIISISVSLPAMWVLCACCAVVLEASEMQGEELERLVRRDPLTGVGNRRLLDEQLDKEIDRHQRSGNQFSILALDLNGFKALNDTLGHAAGDELLRDTASALARAARPQDTVVRQGGDEFLVILPQMSPAHATRVSNAIRANLAGTDTGGLVSTGIGIATFPDDALDGHVLLHVADERLIADKASGPKRGLPPAPPYAPLPESTRAGSRGTDRAPSTTDRAGH